MIKRPCSIAEMSASDLISRITGFVAEAANRSPEEVGPDMNLFEEVGVDSIGIVMVYVEMSMDFGIPEPSPAEDLRAIDTITKLAAYARSFST